LARHETAATIMAAGAATLTGAPGLLVTTLGPGLVNAMNGIADALQERIPLLAVSGVVERAVRGRYTHQILDHAALLRPLVKASFEVEAEGAGAVIERAMALALTPPCGPVHLDLAPAVAAAADPAPREPRAVPRSTAPGVDPADPAIAELRRRLAVAQRPLIVAGFEAARTDCAPVINGIADRHAVPVLTTYKAKGVLDERHPRALGGAGLSPAADRVLLPLAARADLVLLAGYDPIEMRLGWLDPFPSTAHVAELTAAPVDHAMHRVDQRLVGPVGPLLHALFDGLASPPRWPEGEPDRARGQLAKLFAVPVGWGPHAVFATLAEALPAEAVVTVDSGAHRILFSQMWRAARPLQLLQSTGFCTMAAALPLAIGARISEPARPVIAVLGDGGLEMGLGELGTLRDQGLPVVLVVLQDASLALIELKQQDAGLVRAGVAMGRTDLPALARAFGGYGVEVASADGLRSALGDALAADRFTILACRIEAAAYRGRF
jgi:acetolactate synthase-1/2/3 large subunit